MNLLPTVHFALCGACTIVGQRVLAGRAFLWLVPLRGDLSVETLVQHLGSLSQASRTCARAVAALAGAISLVNSDRP